MGRVVCLMTDRRGRIRNLLAYGGRGVARLLGDRAGRLLRFALQFARHLAGIGPLLLLRAPCAWDVRHDCSPWSESSRREVPSRNPVRGVIARGTAAGSLTSGK